MRTQKSLLLFFARAIFVGFSLVSISVGLEQGLSSGLFTFGLWLIIYSFIGALVSYLDKDIGE